MREVVAHVDEIRPPRRDSLNVTERPLKRKMRRMLTLAKSVQDQRVDTLQLLNRRLRQLMAI